MLDELQTFAAQLAQHREIFAGYLAHLDEAGLNARRTGEEYSPRQTLGHLVGACVSMTQIARKIAAGENPQLRPDFDLNFFNRRQQEKRANRTREELFQDWQAAHSELEAFMERLAEADLVKRGQHPVVGDTDLRGLIHVIVEHEVEHIDRVMQVPSQLPHA